MEELQLKGAGVLVIDDEPLIRKRLARHLEAMGGDVSTAETLDAGRRLATDLAVEYVLLDVNLPDGSGLTLLRDKAFSPNAAVVVMTANADINGAVEAMQLGAVDYLVKPFEPAELSLIFKRARQKLRSSRIEEHRQADTSSKDFFFGEALAPLESQLQKILAADNRMRTSLPPVLIHGETGTGKTTIARRLTRSGPRKDKPLVEVNCSALPESLAESELFGHEKGAFTDARAARIGLFEAADGGTLFLDELPSLSPALQAKVLTAIEDQKIRRLGGTKEISVDVRIVAATNQDLTELVKSGDFREDLYHRLDLFRLRIPPLRERGQDIVKLAESLMAEIARRHRMAPRSFSETGRRRLLAHPWNGNVRELAHELERALVFEDSDELEFEQIAMAGGNQTVSLADPREWFNEGFEFPSEGFDLEEAINRIIAHALKQANNNVSAAARLLGVSRDYIRYRMTNKGLANGE